MAERALCGVEGQVAYPGGEKLDGKAASTASRRGLSKRVETPGRLEPGSGRARRGAMMDRRGLGRAAAGEGGGPCLDPQVAEGNGPITWRARKSHVVAQKGDPWEAIPGPK